MSDAAFQLSVDYACCFLEEDSFAFHIHEKTETVRTSKRVLLKL